MDVGVLVGVAVGGASVDVNVSVGIASVGMGVSVVVWTNGIKGVAATWSTGLVATVDGREQARRKAKIIKVDKNFFMFITFKLYSIP